MKDEAILYKYQIQFLRGTISSIVTYGDFAENWTYVISTSADSAADGALSPDWNISEKNILIKIEQVKEVVYVRRLIVQDFIVLQ